MANQREADQAVAKALVEAAQRMRGGEESPKVDAASEELIASLVAADRWDFDIFRLETAAGGKPLSRLGIWLFGWTGLVDEYGLKVEPLMNFLLEIEDLYEDHPYHNAAHGADVLQSMYLIVTKGGVLADLGYGKVELMACLLAAYCHDVGHRGVNNDFLVKSADPLAAKYQDVSPMENHHLATTFDTMALEGRDFDTALGATDREELRLQITEMILATDMKRHFDLARSFEARVGGAHAAAQAAAEGGADGAAEAPAADTPPAAPVAPRQLSAEDKRLCLSIAIKMADLGAMSAPSATMVEWCCRLQEEMWRQGDLEREKGLAISFLMDRTHGDGVAGSKNTVGFYDVILLPLSKGFTPTFPGAGPFLGALMSNYGKWKEAAAEEAKAGAGQQIRPGMTPGGGEGGACRGEGGGGAGKAGAGEQRVEADPV